MELPLSGATGGANRSANFPPRKFKFWHRVKKKRRPNVPFFVQIFLDTKNFDKSRKQTNADKQRFYMPVAASGTGGEKEKI